MDQNNTLNVASVSELYARQNYAVDEGDAEAFAATYTPDGTFNSPTYGESIVGTEALIELAQRVHAELAAEGVQQRHWLNNVVVDTQASTARSYVMVVRTGPDGVCALLRHIIVTDELVFDEHGKLKVRARQVRRDG